MPNPKLETYKNKATGVVYDYTDADAQSKIPSTASSSNKMATASDIQNVYEANGVLGAKNRFPITLDALKIANVRGTWSGNVYTDSTGVTFTVTEENGYVTTITANNAASGNVSIFYVKNANFDGKYIVNGCPSGGEWSDTQKYRVRIGKYDGTFLQTDLGNGVEVTFPSGGGAEFQINTGVGYTCNNLAFKLMARDVNDPDSTYAPFVETNAQLMKSRVDWESYAKTGAVNELENKATSNANFTVNADKTVSVNANLVSDATIDINSSITITRKMRLTGCPSGGGGSKYQLVAKIDSTYITDNGDGVELEAGTYRIYIVVKAGYGSGLIFKPMIADLSYTGGYVPHAMTNRELTEKVTPKNITSDYLTSESLTTAGVTMLSDSRVYRIGKQIIADLVLQRSGGWTKDDTITIATKTEYRPTVVGSGAVINTIGFTKPTQWNVIPEFATVYMNYQNIGIQNKGTTTNEFLVLHLNYTTD